MKLSRLLIALVCLIGVAAYTDDEQEKEKERTEIRQMSQDTLARLYKAQPSAKAAVEKAHGYAVFSNTGIKILFGGSGKGAGVVIQNRNKAETLMKMLEIQAGLGMGVKKFRVICKGILRHRIQLPKEKGMFAWALIWPILII